MHLSGDLLKSSLDVIFKTANNLYFGNLVFNLST